MMKSRDDIGGEKGQKRESNWEGWRETLRQTRVNVN